jgi:hypothetical protein
MIIIFCQFQMMSGLVAYTEDVKVIDVRRKNRIHKGSVCKNH